MKNWTTVGMLAIAIVGTAVISINLVSYAPEILIAYGGVSLDPDDVAHSMVVRINEFGDRHEHSFDSFSRIGFSSGVENFRLESLPSKDKEKFYELMSEALADVDPISRPTLLDVHVDLYSGDGKKIYTLEYPKCKVIDYYLNGIDSKGKVSFLEEEDDAPLIEIREVTKFSCAGFEIILD